MFDDLKPMLELDIDGIVIDALTKDNKVERVFKTIYSTYKTN